MQRKEFLKRAGFGLFSANVLMACKGNSEVLTPGTTGTTDPSSATITPASCSVTDTETDGPYPDYANRTATTQRVDVREGKTGLPLNMNLFVRNVNAGCAIIQNARVDIWYCDKDGYYSGYTNSGYLGNQNNVGKTFCRGEQFTDTTGVAKFLGIYPGWYQGRATHIHVQVYVGGNLKLTSQIALPEEINTAVYNTDLYKAHGQNSTKNSTDSILRDSLSNELGIVVANTAGGYDLTHTIYVKA